MLSEFDVEYGESQELLFEIAEEEPEIELAFGNAFAGFPEVQIDFGQEREKNEYEPDRTEEAIAPIAPASFDSAVDADKYVYDRAFFEEGEATTGFQTAQVLPAVETINKYLPCFYYEDKVLLTLSLWGGKKQGESLFFSLTCDDTVCYVGVIDSCVCKGEVPAVNLLKKQNKDVFDFICWTHPDLDHTRGMPDILREHVGKDTLFCMPSIKGWTSSSQYNKTALAAYKFLKRTLTTEKKRIGRIYRVNNKMELACVQLMKLGESRPTLMELHSFAPLDDYVLSREAKEHKLSANAYSVGILLSIGDNLHCLLGGDVENKTLEKARNNGWLFRSFQYVKVPHHGSDTSSNLPTYLRESAVKLQTVATTAFISHKLPKDEVLRGYHQLGAKVYMTAPLPPANGSSQEFGVVETIIEWRPKEEPICTTILNGNAVAYVPD